MPTWQRATLQLFAFLTKIFKAFSSACEAFGVSLLPTVRLVLDKAMAAHLALRLEAFHRVAEDDTKAVPLG